MRNRKIMALAVAGALGAPAVAFAQSEIEVYGRLYPEFTRMNSSGATDATATIGNGQLSNLSSVATAQGTNLQGRYSVDASNSRIGFRGKEDLGGGLKTVWQIEQKATIDTGASGALANRDSFVGLQGGGFGTIRLGNMTTVYKSNREPIRFFGIESGNFISANGVISSSPWGNKNAFHVRQPNSIRYDSPVVGGVEVGVQYSPDEIRQQSPGSASLNAYLVSFGVKYESGPLYLTLSHEIHNDFFGASGEGLNAAVANGPPLNGSNDLHSKDSATRAVAGYKLGPARFAVSYSPIEYTESGTRAAGKFDSYKNKTYELVWEQTWTGTIKTEAFYAGASAGTCTLAGGVACSTDGLEGKMVAVGGEYSFSKRTALFALYAKLINGSSAAFDNTANVSKVSVGTDITNIAVGVK